MADESGEKNEEPTPHKLREARKKGQIAKGKDITGALLLFVSFFSLQATAMTMWTNLGNLSRFAFEQIPREFSTPVVGKILEEALILFLLTVGPMFAATFAVALIVEALQTGFLITFEPLTPKLEKLNPIEGIKKMFALKQWVELLNSLAKMIVVIWIIYGAIKAKFYLVLESQQMSLWQMMIAVGDIVMTVVIRVGLFYIVLAFIDYFYQRWEYLKQMRMSKKDIKEEYKRLEGDPMIKQRQRDAARALASGRQMGAVPGADVVVTNPVHLAIAIQYKAKEMKAPVVVAKGKRRVAEAIKKIAEENHVPIIENQPLAQAIFKGTPVGGEVPAAYYKAVAEILAFVYNLKKKRKRRAGA